MIKIQHNAGFFSCCSVRLNKIVDYINLEKKLPNIVDSSKQFKWYKNNENKKKDITFHYFKNYKNILKSDVIFPIKYHHNHQFKIYSDIDYQSLTPLIHKYFSPSNGIKNIITQIKEKYTLDYGNICVLFYRGNDKNRETKKCTYDEYTNYADDLLRKNTKLQFLIQSDETEFIECMKKKFPDNFLCFENEIRHMKKCDSTVDKKMRSNIFEFSKNYLAITIIMSKCKYIICGSGNCDIWIMLYRGNNKNIKQNLNGIWYDNIE